MDAANLASAKVVLLDADNVNLAGGAEGSVYRFYYQAANKIFVEARGITTAATPALDGNASTTTGWS